MDNPYCSCKWHTAALVRARNAPRTHQLAEEIAVGEQAEVRPERPIPALLLPEHVLAYSCSGDYPQGLQL